MNVLVSQTNKGEAALIMVLEPGNIELLKQAKPIVTHLESWFPDGIPRKVELVIFYSTTPVADAREFAKMAKMAFDERTPRAKTTRPHCPECKSTIEQLAVWRNDSPMALTFCHQCGCVFGMVPQDIVAGLPKT